MFVENPFIGLILVKELITIATKIIVDYKLKIYTSIYISLLSKSTSKTRFLKTSKKNNFKNI
jgi:hypothetical protein